MSAALVRLCDGPGMSRRVAVWVVVVGQGVILAAGLAVCGAAGVLS